MSSTTSTKPVQVDEASPVVLMLVGLIGSGKSTFAQALEEHLPRFRRCNQDDLGDRRRVENLARKTLREKMSPCIDRTNFDASQRSYWINIAREFPGTPVWVIVFDTPYEVCAARLRERVSHPTITTPEQGLNLLARFAGDFEYPSPREGYTRLISLTPDHQSTPTYTHNDVTSILQRLQDSPPVTSPPLSFRGDRARGRYYRGATRTSYSQGRARGRGSFSASGSSSSPGRSRDTAYKEAESHRASAGKSFDSANWRSGGT